MSIDTKPLGCYVEGSCMNTDEFNEAICDFAFECGLPYPDDYHAIIGRMGRSEWTDDDSEALNEIADEAIEALNQADLPIPAFSYWELYEGSLCLTPSVDAAESMDNGEVLKVSGVPDYLLSVNDHGNATLYAVTVKEVWSVV